MHCCIDYDDEFSYKTSFFTLKTISRQMHIFKLNLIMDEMIQQCVPPLLTNFLGGITLKSRSFFILILIFYSHQLMSKILVKRVSSVSLEPLLYILETTGTYDILRSLHLLRGTSGVQTMKYLFEASSS